MANGTALGLAKSASVTGATSSGVGSPARLMAALVLFSFAPLAARPPAGVEKLPEAMPPFAAAALSSEAACSPSAARRRRCFCSSPPAVRAGPLAFLVGPVLCLAAHFRPAPLASSRVGQHGQFQFGVGSEPESVGRRLYKPRQHLWQIVGRGECLVDVGQPKWFLGFDEVGGRLSRSRRLVVDASVTKRGSKDRRRFGRRERRVLEARPWIGRSKPGARQLRSLGQPARRHTRSCGPTVSGNAPSVFTWQRRRALGRRYAHAVWPIVGPGAEPHRRPRRRHRPDGHAGTSRPRFARFADLGHRGHLGNADAAAGRCAAVFVGDVRHAGDWPPGPTL